MIAPIIEIENNILESLKKLFEGEIFDTEKLGKKELKFYKGFLPYVEYKERIKNNDKDGNETKDIPFILLKYRGDIQTLREGEYDGTATFEMIIGTYNKSSSGYHTNMYIADKIKKKFMEYSNVPEEYAICQNYIKTELLDDACSNYYWFSRLEFKAYIPCYTSEIKIY
ncbi:hypothetical protein [Fusobacterium ulcerans]|uniref:hypothetical protein n=1 Tax=Fusobacterium ulcerans TaxID=861 RepID=UPI0026EA83F7|nr:hypothetical protein [Fusobacterium ulcerans]